MKKIFFALVIGAIAVGCNSSDSAKKDYKVVRDEVIQYHEVVMADQGIIIENQMRLDSLLKDMKAFKLKFPEIDTAKEKDVIQAAILSLASADNRMNNWMHRFEPDVEGKSNDQAVRYFEAEKAKVATIDSVYKVQIKLSGDLLKRFQR